VVKVCHCPSVSSESSSTANARTVRIPTVATSGPPKSGAGPLMSSCTFASVGRNLQRLNAQDPSNVLRQMAASLAVCTNGRRARMR
jgi:hypothetical protein